MRFQDTIYGRELAAQGRGARLRKGRDVVDSVRALYADHVYISLALDYAQAAGLITTVERLDADEYLMQGGE